MVLRNNLNTQKFSRLEDPDATVAASKEAYLCLRNLWTCCLLSIFPVLAGTVFVLGHLMCYNANEIGYIDYVDLYRRNTIVEQWENNYGPFLANYYFSKRDPIIHSDIVDSKLPGPPIPSPDKCDKFEDSDKFDCFPRGEVNEKDCNARGCCYATSTTKNVPYCFYPRDYASYKYTSVNQTDREVVALLAQQFKSPYPKDLPKLKLTASLISDEVLIVMITDEKDSRYRVPFPEFPTPSKRFSDSLYDFKLNMNSTGFKVTRKNSNTTIFDTGNVGGFIFSDQMIQISAKLPTNNIFGIGESKHPFRVGTDWRTITLHNHDSDPRPNVNGYGSHPVYMGLESGGNAHGVFLLTSYSMDIVLQPSPGITYRLIGGPLVLGFVLGPSPVDVSIQYTNIIGRPYLPPYWALGFHLSRFGYKSLDDMREVWNRTRKAKIPFDTQWTDLDYMKNQNDFSISDSFKGLPKFVNQLHDVGMHYVILIDPGVSGSEPKGSYPPFDQGMQKDIFIKDSSGKDPLYGKVWNFKSTVFPDFTHPQAVPYWNKMIGDFHKIVNFDGAWIDMNEPSNMIDGSLSGCPANNFENPPYVPGVDGGKLNYKTICMSAKHHDAEHYVVHNVYGALEAVVTNFAMVNAREGKRPLVISRASSPGLGAFSGHWTGDVHSTWADMAQSISDMLMFSLFGIPLVGADICGFNDNTTVSLCTRWTQLGAFYPFARNHNGKSEMAQDPVALGIENTARVAFTQRYLFLPYLYTLFYKANTVGTPVIWPTFYIAPEDENTYNLEDQFMWGNGLLIAPALTEGLTFVTPYLPKGLWYSLDSLDMVLIESNGKKVSLPAPEDRGPPVLIRGGVVIPTQEPHVTTTISRLRPYMLAVALDASNTSRGELYVDDGDTFEGGYILLSFEAKNNTLESKIEDWTLDVDLTLASMVVMGNFTSPLSSVKVNGQPSKFNFTQVLFINMDNWNLKNKFVIEWS